MTNRAIAVLEEVLRAVITHLRMFGNPQSLGVADNLNALLREPATDVCECGHPEADHNRDSGECGFCDCTAYRQREGKGNGDMVARANGLHCWTHRNSTQRCARLEVTANRIQDCKPAKALLRISREPSRPNPYHRGCQR